VLLRYDGPVARLRWFGLGLAVLVAAALHPAVAGAAVRHGTACVARHVVYVEGKLDVQYRPGCTGHDEPELDPVSSLRTRPET